MQMSSLVLVFHFTPADGSAARDITATISTQEDKKRPFRVVIDWGTGEAPDRIPWPGPPLFGLELAARFVAQRILDKVELWGGGALDPEVEKPVPWSTPAKDDTSQGGG
jgi:hypothetical protein